MGLNAVQTLIPWFMMEPTPGAFVTDGFVDIVRFAKLCDKHGLKIVLRPGPFICDGPDFGARSCLCEMMLARLNLGFAGVAGGLHQTSGG